MGEIKSAREIAQEKANKLGDLSPEERQGQRQDRCRVIGQSLAEKYLSQYDFASFEEQLSQHDSQDKYLISQAAVRRLIEGIDLRYSTTLDKISQGILPLAGAATTAKILDKIKELSHEYEEAEKRERQEIEKAGKEILHQLRISGTTIGQINIRAKEEWQKKLDQLLQPFDDRLHYLKQQLMASSNV